MYLLGKSADSLGVSFILTADRKVFVQNILIWQKNLLALSLSRLCSIEGDTDSTGFVSLLLPYYFNN